MWNNGFDPEHWWEIYLVAGGFWHGVCCLFTRTQWNVKFFFPLIANMFFVLMFGLKRFLWEFSGFVDWWCSNLTNLHMWVYILWGGRNRGVNFPSPCFLSQFLPTFWANFSLLPKRLPHVFSLLPTLSPYFSLLPTFSGPFLPTPYSVPPPSFVCEFS